MAASEIHFLDARQVSTASRRDDNGTVYTSFEESDRLGARVTFSVRDQAGREALLRILLSAVDQVTEILDEAGELDFSDLTMADGAMGMLDRVTCRVGEARWRRAKVDLEATFRQVDGLEDSDVAQMGQDRAYEDMLYRDQTR